MPSHDRVVADRIARERSLLAEQMTSPCRSYRAGHNVHWIQALNSANKPEVSRRTWRAAITEMTPTGLVVVRDNGEVHRFLHHHMERLAALCDGVASEVKINSEYAILRVPSRDGAYCFSVQLDDGKPLDACVFE